MRTFLILLSIGLSACATERIEDIRETSTGILEGEGVVIMARSYHLGNETEASFIKCVTKELGKDLRVIPSSEFIDALFPWFEPRTAPADTKGLPTLMERPGVAKKIAEKNVRYMIWVDGDTDRVGGGGSLSCAVGPGGGGCFGFAWWTKDSKYNATVWDLVAMKSAGSVSTDVTGTSYMPAIIIPIPLISRTQTKACKGLADELKLFINDES